MGIGLRYSSNGLALAFPARLTAASKVATPTPRRAYARDSGDLKGGSSLFTEKSDSLAECVEREGNGWYGLRITWTSLFMTKQLHFEAHREVCSYGANPSDCYSGDALHLWSSGVRIGIPFRWCGETRLGKMIAYGARTHHERRLPARGGNRRCGRGVAK
jgi:hypothetical protein